MFRINQDFGEETPGLALVQEYLKVRLAGECMHDCMGP